ncbi:hypothetical protein [uncultured Levyella sp.]|uniref:hypothetical protein n=1 Tax=uncultured Levyella sp. TaxID=1715800 RepID=UPI00258A0924|nr:hypothetical protein [uncultured Levyella sp.]
MTELLDLIKDPDLKDLMGKAKSETSFDDIIKGLNDLNPWNAPDEKETNRKDFVENLEKYFSKKEWEKEGALEEELKKLPGIANEDKGVFIPLLAYNILENIYSVLPHDKINTEDTFKKKVLIALMICLPFMDYQQAFDGNLCDPRVIILGINPRFKADTFYDYEQKEEKKFMVDHMKEVYKTPIRDGNCSMMYKMNKNGEKIKPTDLHIAEDDYYYGKNGHFYPNVSDDLKEEHRSHCLGKEGKNPLAFLELFPYASKGVNTWWNTEDLIHACKLLQYDGAVYNDIKAWATDNIDDISNISWVIKNKIGLKSNELLYSQQWILCLLYCILIKNSKSIEHDKWFVISTRSAGDLLKRLEAFINTAIKIENNPNEKKSKFCFLTTNSSRSRYLTPTNLAVVENGVKGIKINEPNAERFWNTSDTSASQNATGSTKDQENETLNNQSFRHLWGIKKKVKDK